VGFIRTVTAPVRPAATVKCAPSILKSFAVTEIRYLPAGSPVSGVASESSDWSPWATIGASPDVFRIDGHGQVSAKSGSWLPPGAVAGRQSWVPGSACVPGSPVSSTLISHR
jgi:hypothetical protein